MGKSEKLVIEKLFPMTIFLPRCQEMKRQKNSTSDSGGRVIYEIVYIGLLSTFVVSFWFVTLLITLADI